MTAAAPPTSLRLLSTPDNAGRLRLAVALVHPLTARGIRATLAGLAAGLRRSPARGGRAAAVAAVLAAAYLAGGWAGLVCGVLVPRLLLYPQLAWMSLLVEHTWFDAEPRTGSPAWVEASRCLRLYPRNRALAHLTAVTWLPCGDLHHFAHSGPPQRALELPARPRTAPGRTTLHARRSSPGPRLRRPAALRCAAGPPGPHHARSPSPCRKPCSTHPTWRHHRNVAVRYLPAVGSLNACGDWYDVVDIPPDLLALAIGDVIGHGLQAAAVMGMLRSALSATIRAVQRPAQAWRSSVCTPGPWPVPWAPLPSKRSSTPAAA